MASFSAGTTFTDGVANDVTAAKLAALVNAATPTSGLIQDRTAETTIAADDTLLIGDASDSNNLKRITVANFNNVVTTGTGTAASPAIVPTGDSNTGIFFPAADTIAFSEGGAEAMRIDSSGNVGIKNSTPSSYNAAATDLVIGSGSSNSGITITASTNGLGSIHFSDGTSGDTAYRGIIKYEHTTDNLQLFTAATERLRIDSSGNVGIGTTSPACRLHLVAPDVQLRFTNGSSHVRHLGVVDADNSLRIARTGVADDFTINSSGNVLIGTIAVNPIASRSNGIATGPVGFMTLRGANNLGLGLDSNSGSHIAFYTDNGSAYVNAGTITSTGNSTAYNTSSDYRLKTNLEPISNGINRLKQLLVYRFNWISDIEGNKVDGFVAHEAQAIVPECVTGEKDAVDADGKPLYQGIDQSKIVPLLTAAIKEAILKIEILESKVATLEAA